MKIEYSPTARKQLRRLSKNKRRKVLEKIESLRGNPHLGKRLRGEFVGFYSLKVWPYRVIYSYFPKSKLLFINIIQHRQQAYK